MEVYVGDVDMYSVAKIKEYEKNIIAAVKIDNTIHDEYEITPELFIETKNKEIYSVIKNIIESGNQANDVTIFEELEKRKSEITITDIIELDTVSIANVKFYIDCVKNYQMGIRLRRLALSIADKVKSRDYDECIELIEKEVQEISIDSNSGMIYHIRDLLNDTLNEIERRYQSGGEIDGIESGFPTIDKILCGLGKQQLIIIAARPSVGKTALILRMILSIARREIPCGLFSCEESKFNNVLRMIAIESEINFYALRTGRLNKSDFNKMMVAFDQLYKDIVYIDDTPNIKMKKLRSNARIMVRKGVQVIFIDYLTLIQGNMDLPRHERVGEIVKKLKQLARELDIPIIVLSQLRREAEDKKPTLADLRQSGEIEEDADIVLLIGGKREEAERQCIIAKNRGGELDTVKLFLKRSCLKFEEMAERE